MPAWFHRADTWYADFDRWTKQIEDEYLPSLEPILDELTKIVGLADEPR